jgi:S1-C subfamily serine protease
MVARCRHLALVLLALAGSFVCPASAFAAPDDAGYASALVARLVAEMKPPRDASYALTGTGFFISSAGELLTAEHVVRGCDRIDLVSESLPFTSAELVMADARPDIALLRLPVGSPAAPAILSLAPGAAVAGEPLVVLGYPIGSDMRRATATAVTVADASNPIQANARYVLTFSGTIRQGDSGGPLLDGRGHVVGLVKGGFDDPRVAAGIFGDKFSDMSLGPTRDLVAAFYHHANGGDLPSPRKTAASIAEGIAAARAAVVRVVCWRRSPL